MRCHSADAARVLRPRDDRPERRRRHGGLPCRRGRVDAGRVPHHAVPVAVVCRRARPPARAQRLPRRRCGAGDVQRAHVRRAGDGSARRDAARAAGGVLDAAPRHAARGAAAVAHVGGGRSVVQADAPRGVGARRRPRRRRRRLRDSRAILPVRPRRQRRAARTGPDAQPARPAVACGADGARAAARLRGRGTRLRAGPTAFGLGCDLRARRLGGAGAGVLTGRPPRITGRRAISGVRRRAHWRACCGGSDGSRRPPRHGGWCCSSAGARSWSARRAKRWPSITSTAVDNWKRRDDMPSRVWSRRLGGESGSSSAVAWPGSSGNSREPYRPRRSGPSEEAVPPSQCACPPKPWRRRVHGPRCGQRRAALRRTRPSSTCRPQPCGLPPSSHRTCG